MAGELQVSYRTAKTVYVLVRNTAGQVYNGSAFVTYATADYVGYAISLAEQGTASAYYVGDFPAVAAGRYNVIAKERVGSSPDETDPTIGAETFDWNATAAYSPPTQTASSGQVSNIGPIRLARGTMIQNFPVYLRSATDHVTPFTSGVLSGQIARDGGSFDVLQSGAFTEVGQGFFNLQALTSGDLLANSVKLLFTARGISGGNSDPLPMSFILQRTSGQA